MHIVSKQQKGKTAFEPFMSAFYLVLSLRLTHKVITLIIVRAAEKDGFKFKIRYVRVNINKTLV